MNRKSLGILAIVLIILMAIVATAGLDDLPSKLRTSVDAASTEVSADRSTLDSKRKEVERALQQEPALFRTRATDWRTRLERASSQVGKSEAELSTLKKLVGENRREDAPKVEEGLARLESARAGGVREAEQIAAEADRWLSYKRDLPKQLAAMNGHYETVRGFDVAAATAAVTKAITDWPAKRQDLETRLAALTASKTRAEETWNASAAARAQAEKGADDAVDYPALFQAADGLRDAERGTREGVDALNRLAGQLYVNWDKLLVEVEDDKQKVRFVRTQFQDATLANGQTTQEEKWEPIGRARAEDVERNTGMVIAHKPAGKYDSEAEAGPQAPGYAYIAPAGQANMYGAWNNGVWTWLPQYLIMSQLLRGPSYPPITSGDYGSYQRARQRGEVFYGHSTRAGGSTLRRTIDRMRSGNSSSGGGFWREREQPKASSGGYSGSRYESRGSYSGSRYQSRPGGFRSYSRGTGGFRGGRR